MLKKLPNLFTCLVTAFAFTSATAQVYQTMPISTGLNTDVIANGVGSASVTTTLAADASNYNFLSADFQPTASSPLPGVGLPVNGTINSVSTTGLSFQLATYSGSNSLRLTTTGSGTLVFTNQIAAAKLFLLGCTGNGPSNVNVTVTFSDNSTQVINAVVVPDWFDSTTQPLAISGFGRVLRTTNVVETPLGNPRFYQMPVDISPANQGKTIKNVIVAKTTSTGIVNILAVSAELSAACQAPYNIAAVPTMDGATVTWTAPGTAPASGYEYVITTTATTPSATATPTGTVAAGVTTQTVTGLITGLQYYFWIRSNCGAEKGSWQQASFTAGQVSFTYTTGDISSLYGTASSLTPTSTTTCPGTMSVTVPAGYKIKTINTTYNMTSPTAGGAFMSEQRSLLYCTTSNVGETALFAGVGSSGTYTYNRTNIPIANNLTGTVNFELRAWRVYGGSGCNVTYVKVDNNTWKINAILESLICTTPATPSSTAHTMCPSALFSETVVNGIPGAVYKWYTQPTGGTALLATDQIFTGTFYVTQTVGTCESARSAGFVITASGTANPTAAPQTYCDGITVAALQTTSGTGVKWYAALTGGSPLAASVALATGNYYVSQTLNNCESARTTVAITINTTPPPTVTDQVFCAGSGATVANLQAGLVAGGTIKWFATDVSTTPLDPTTVLGSGTYYTTQTLGVCESIRVPVAVAVATIVAPASDPVEVCAGTTVADLVGNGSPTATYKWFAAQADTTPLALDTPVTNGTYYVSQTINTCESQKAAIIITVNNIAAPVVEDQEFCAGAKVTHLQATAAAGATIKWYETETSTTALSFSAPLVTGTYYASQKLNTCESDRTAVEIIVNAVVPAVTETTTLACNNSTIGDLTLESAEEGATLKWYVNAGSITPLAAETLLTASTYYVSQTIGECESLRAAVAVSFNVIPLPTTTSLTVCTGLTFADLQVEGVDGASFSWYSTIDEDAMIESTETVSAGTFYVSQTIDGCEGGRTAVAVSTIFTLAPSPTAEQAFCGDALVSDLVSGANEGYTVSWYSPEGDLLASDSALATGTYTVTQTANNCESTAESVSVTVIPTVGTPDGATEQDYTAGETAGDLEVEFIGGATVQWFFLDEDVWVAIPAATPLIDGAVYGVQQSVGACQSDILSITVNMVLGNEEFHLSNLNIYPNPSSDVVNVEGRDTLSEITVINLLGQKVLSSKVNATSAQINISALPQATYILQVYGANGGTASFKIVKQ